MPRWALRVVAMGDADLLELRDHAAHGKSTSNEAELVGKLYGYGRQGRGREGWLGRSARQKREGEIFAEVPNSWFGMAKS